MVLEKYSIGIGDRFGREGEAQLRALQLADAQGMHIVPVWNKSNREHTLIGTSPDDARRAADLAVVACGWKGTYYVDADHIGLATVDKFLNASNFYTIDVADFIGKPPAEEKVSSFVNSMARFKGKLHIPGMEAPVDVTSELLEKVGRQYLVATEEAGKVYQHIVGKKGAENFVTEVSVDESADPQTPAELFFILASLSLEGVPVQTIAPKFTGAFLKGVDYVGDVRQFAREFEDDLAVLRFAVKTFDFPGNLKLSVHSGSDKFSLYPVIHRALRKFDVGVHLKTAGTTWLEEVIGLAASGGSGLKFVKHVYAEAMKRYDELCQPYLAVIHIDKDRLPVPATVDSWSAAEFVEALEHDQSKKRFDREFRQLIHIAFRIASENNEEFGRLLTECRAVIELKVTDNIYRRHIQPLFLGESSGA